MQEMTLEEFVNWVVEDVSEYKDQKGKQNLLETIETNLQEAERLISQQIHHWVVRVLTVKRKLILIDDMSLTSKKICLKLKEVLPNQLR